MPRVVMIGCGTGVGKTRVSTALLRELRARGQHCVGLKPIESGLTPGASGEPPVSSDAAQLSAAGSLRTKLAHPLYALREPVSPHLAARNSGLVIDLRGVANWVREAEIGMTPYLSSDRALWSIVETAGGLLSPLARGQSNFDLARALEPAIWVLVAADALGVLHDVSATLEVLAARGRPPDHVVLSQAREPDASTGGNATELDLLGIVTPSALLERDDDSGIAPLVDRLFASAN